MEAVGVGVGFGIFLAKAPRRKVGNSNYRESSLGVFAPWREYSPIPPAFLSNRLRDAVQLCRILIQNRHLRRLANVGAFLQDSGGAAVAVAVGHVTAEDHLAFADQIQNIRQDFVFDFSFARKANDELRASGWKP